MFPVYRPKILCFEYNVFLNLKLSLNQKVNVFSFSLILKKHLFWLKYSLLDQGSELTKSLICPGLTLKDYEFVLQ